MTAVTRNPTSDEAVSGTWTGTAGSRWTVVNDHPDASGSSELTHGTTSGDLTFGFSALSIPSGSTITNVEVIYYDYRNGGAGCTFGARLKVGGNYYNASTHNPGNGSANRTLRTDSWATNPKSGIGWTVDDVNGVGSNALEAFGYNSGIDANPTITTSSIQLVVDYDEPAGPVSGSSSGSSVISATAIAWGFLVGNVSQGLATLTGVAQAAGFLAGSTTSTTTASGTVEAVGLLSGSATGEATASGVLSTILASDRVRYTQHRIGRPGQLYGSFHRALDSEELIGASQGVASVSGTLTAEGYIAGSVSSVATATGTILATALLSGTSECVATATGSLISVSGLAGSVSCAASVSGTLIGSASLTGSVVGSSTTTGALTAFGRMVGDCIATSQTTGQVVARGFLAGSVFGEASASGNLTEAGLVLQYYYYLTG